MLWTGGVWGYTCRMRVSAGSLSLLCLLAFLPLAGLAADRLVVFVAYDPAAPLDASRSYACEALAPDDASYDAHRTGRLPLDCRRIPLADLCGTVGAGDAKTLDPDCHLLPVAGRAPTDAQVRQFADGLEAYFKGNLPKLNFTLLEMSRRPGAGFQANLRAGPQGASPAVGAWDAAAPAERVALATPLLTVDPAQPDTRYGNGWQNPHGSEWGGYLSKRTLDEVESDVRRALATPENPVPSATAVATRASAEVARCRGSSVDALRADLRSHVARMAGRSAPRPALDLPGNCKVDAAPALVLPPPPPPREWTATKPCGSGARTFTSTVSQADANRMAREFRCPTWTASACGTTFTSSVSQADANRQAANRRPCTYTAYKTCDSQTRSFTSSVSQAAAAAAARAWSCPVVPPREWTATKQCGSGEQEFTSRVSQADANRKAREFRCPTWTASACGTTFTSDVSQADANRQAAERRPCTYTAYKTCGSQTRSFTSSVSQAAAAAAARAWSCPGTTRVTSRVSPPPPPDPDPDPDPDPETYTASKRCGSGEQEFESTVSQADADRMARNHVCQRWTASACGDTFTSDVSQADANRMAANRRPCTYTAYKSCPSGRQRFTSSVSRADADRKAARASCPTWTARQCGKTFTSYVGQPDANRMAADALPCGSYTKSCPSGISQTFTSNVSQAHARALADRWSCPVFTARDCKGITHRSKRSQDDADRMAAGVVCRWRFTKSCPGGTRKTFTSTESQAHARALADRWSCPVFTARDCKGVTHSTNRGQAAADALAAKVKCPVSRPAVQRQLYETSYDVRDGECDSSDPTCGGTRDESTFDPTDKVHVVVQQPAPAPAPAPRARTYYAYRTCGGTRKTFRSTVSQSAAQRLASAYRCPAPTRTYYAYRTCGIGVRRTFSSRVSQAAANRRASAFVCEAGPPRTRTYYAYRTCGSTRKTFSSRVSQAAANRSASAYRCPVTTSSTPRASYKLCNGRYVYVVSCPASGSGSAASSAPRRVMMCNGRYVYASSCAGR